MDEQRPAPPVLGLPPRDHRAHPPVGPSAPAFLSLGCEAKHVSTSVHLGTRACLTQTLPMASCHLYWFPFVVITTNSVFSSSGGQLSTTGLVGLKSRCGQGRLPLESHGGLCPFAFPTLSQWCVTPHGSPGVTRTLQDNHSIPFAKLLCCQAGSRAHKFPWGWDEAALPTPPSFIPRQPRCSFLGGTSLPVTALPCLPPSSSSEQSSGQSHSLPLADSPVGVACPAPAPSGCSCPSTTPLSVLAGPRRSPWPPHHVALLTNTFITTQNCLCVYSPAPSIDERCAQDSSGPRRQSSCRRSPNVCKMNKEFRGSS